MGGGSSRAWCVKQDHIDKKTEVDLSVGLSIAKSEACGTCALSFPLGNTASATNMTRDHNTIVIRPFTPFIAVFNGRQFSLTEMRLYHPAPMRVEGVQADAVLQCNSGADLEIFIPLSKGNSIGASGEFLNAIGMRLDPSSSGGLGIVNKDTGAYEQIDIVTGQDWSLTNLVSDKDPYFTWVDSKLEQYVKFDGICDRYIGWRSTPGPQVIYFQKPVSVSAGDLDKLATTVGAVMPKDALSTVTHPLYAAGKANCPTPLPKMKAPSFNFESGAGRTMLYVFGAFFVILIVAGAAMFVNSFSVQSIGRTVRDNIGSVATVPTTPTPPTPEHEVFGGINNALKAATNPADALAGLAGKAQSTALGQANAAATTGLGAFGRK